VRQRLAKRAAEATAERVERVLLNALCGEHSSAETRASFADLLRAGVLDNNTVHLELPPAPGDGGGGKRINIGDGACALGQQELPPAFHRD
jgi:hypothetical protein